MPPGSAVLLCSGEVQGQLSCLKPSALGPAHPPVTGDDGGQWAAGTIPPTGSGDQGPLSVDFGMNMPLGDCPDQECLHGFWEYYGSQTYMCNRHMTPGTAELQIKTWPSVAVWLENHFGLR